MHWGETNDAREIARQKAIEATQVRDGVDLRYFTKLNPPIKTAPDTMLIQPYQSSCRIRLAQIMLDGITKERMEIRINKPGDILVMIPNTSGFAITRRKHSAQICGHELAESLRAHGITMPSRYVVTADERIGGWICRKEG